MALINVEVTNFYTFFVRPQNRWVVVNLEGECHWVVKLPGEIRVGGSGEFGATQTVPRPDCPKSAGLSKSVPHKSLPAIFMFVLSWQVPSTGPC